MEVKEEWPNRVAVWEGKCHYRAFHMVIIDDLGEELRNIASWRNQNIPGAIQRMADTEGEVGVVPIFAEVLAHCNKKIATVAAHVEDTVRTRGDVADERG